MNDRGLYSCNLHHLYCHLYETVRVQLNVTKSRMFTLYTSYFCLERVTVSLNWLSFLCFLDHYDAGRKEQRYWDGHKVVYVVMLGSTVALPCINRRNVWTDWSNDEEDQQVYTVWTITYTNIYKTFPDHFILRSSTVGRTKYLRIWLTQGQNKWLCLLIWWTPGGPLGQTGSRNPAWPRGPAGGPVRLGRAAQLWAAVPAEKDEHQ